MFETIVSYVLNKYLGRYIENLDSDNLEIGLWSGKVELNDLQMRPDALSQLQLPVLVKRGLVGNISISLSWTSLWSSPIDVIVTDVYLLAEPVDRDHISLELQQELSLSAKRAMLERLELRDTLQNDNGGLVEGMTVTLLRNVQLEVRDVHIRYEDQISLPYSPIAAGICIANISIKTTDRDWQPATLDSEAPVIYKHVQLSSLIVYWLPYVEPEDLLAGDGPEWMNEMIAIMKQMAESEGIQNLLLQPTSAEIRFSLQLEAPSSLQADADLDAIDLHMTRQQYLSILHVHNSWRRVVAGFGLMSHRPKTSVKEKPRDWWKFVYNAIAHRRLRPYTWTHIRQYIKMFRSYERLYLQYLTRNSVDDVTTNDSESRKRLEIVLNTTSIAIARQRAAFEMARMRASLDERHTNEIDIRGELPLVLDSKLSTEEKTQLRQVITTVAPSSVYGVSVSVPRVSVSLSARSSEVLLVTAASVRGSVTSDHHGRNLRDSAARERTVPESVVPERTVPERDVPERRVPESGGQGYWRLELSIGAMTVQGVTPDHILAPLLSVTEHRSGDSTPVISLSVERNSGEGQLVVDARLAPVQLVYSEYTASELLLFIQTPFISISELESAGLRGVEGSKRTVTAMANTILDEKQTVHVTLNLNSPLLILPKSGSLQSGGSVLVIDPGHILVTTELTSLPVYSDSSAIHSPLGDSSEVPNQNYDRYHIQFSHIQVLMADAGDDWRSSLEVNHSQNHVLSRLGVDLVLAVSRQSDSPTHPLHRVDVVTEAVHIRLPDSRVKQLLGFFLQFPTPRVLKYRRAVQQLPLEARISTDHCQVEPKVNELYDTLQSVKRNLTSTINRRQERLDKQLSRSSGVTSAGDDVQRTMTSAVSSGPAGDIVTSLSDPKKRTTDHNTTATPNTADVAVAVSLQVPQVTAEVVRYENSTVTCHVTLEVSRLSVSVQSGATGSSARVLVGAATLLDRLRSDRSGNQLQMLRGSDETPPLLQLQYTQISSACTDFQSAQRSVVKSFQLNLGDWMVELNRDAWLALFSFYRHLVLHAMGSSGKTYSAPLRKLREKTMAGLQTGPLELQKEAGSDAVLLEVSLRIDRMVFKLSRTTQWHEMMQLQLSGGELVYRWTADGETWLKLLLSNVSLTDLTDTTLHSELFVTHKEDLLEIEVSLKPAELFSQKKLTTLPQGSLNFSTGRFVVVLTETKLLRLMSLLDPLVAEVISWGAGDEGAQSEDRSAGYTRMSQLPRLSLTVRVSSPQLVLPLSDSCRRSIVLHLGLLTAQNVFTLHQSPAPHVLDSVTLRLSNCRVTHSETDLSYELKISEILSPFELKLDLVRCASAPLPGVPILNCSLKISSLVFKLTGTDISSIYCLVKKWSPPAEVSSFSSDRLTRFSAGTRDEYSQTRVTERVQTLHSGRGEENVILSALVESIRVSLHDGSINELMEGEDSVDFNDASAASTTSNDTQYGDSLLLCDVEVLCFSISILSEGGARGTLTLQNVTAIDGRSHSPESATRVLQRDLSTTEANSHLLEVNLNMSMSNEEESAIEVSASLQPLKFTITVPYTALLIDFYKRLRLSQTASTTSSHCDKTDLPVRSEVSLQSDSEEDSANVSQLLSSDGKRAKHNSVNVTLLVKRPAVVLLADPTGLTGGHILVTTDLSVTFTQNDVESKISASLIDITAKHGQVSGTECQLLSPVSILFTATRNENFIAEIRFETEVHLHITASLVAIVSTLNEEMRFLTTRLDASGVVSDLQPEKDLWSLKKVPSLELPTSARDEESLLAKAGGLALRDDGCVVSSLTKSHHQSISLTLPRITLTFERENPSTPIILVKSCLEMEVHDWSSSVYIKGEIELEACVFSGDIGRWEPLLEPVCDSTGLYRPFEMVFRVFRAAAVPLTECSNVRFEGVSCVDSRAQKEKTSSGPEDNDIIMVKANKDTQQERRLDRSLVSVAPYADTGTPDSDSFSSDGDLRERIVSAITDLFKSDEQDGYRLVDSSGDGGNGTAKTAATAPQNVDQYRENECDTVVPGINEKTATFFLLDARDRLDITLSPMSLAVITEDGGAEVIFACSSGSHQIILNKNSLPELDFNIPSCDFHSSSAEDTAPHSIFYSIRFEAKDFLVTECALKFASHRKVIKVLRKSSDAIEYNVHLSVSTSHRSTTIVLSSPLKVLNNWEHPLVLLNQSIKPKHNDKATVEVPVQPTVIQPRDTWHVPLLMAYHCRYVILPMNDRHSVRGEAVACRELLESELPTLLRFEASPDSNGLEPLVLQVVAYFDSEPSRQSGSESWSSERSVGAGHYGGAAVTMEVCCAAVVHNWLPFGVSVAGDTVQPGRALALSSLDPHQCPVIPVELPDYKEEQWRGKWRLTSDPARTGSVTLQSNSGLSLLLQVNRRRSATLQFDLGTSVWLKNETGLDLQVQLSCCGKAVVDVSAGETENTENDHTSATLLGCSRCEESWLRVRVQGDSADTWSSSVSLQAVPSSGLIMCRNDERKKRYRILMKTRMYRGFPTRVVSLKNYFIVMNCTSRSVSFMEDNAAADLWHQLSPGENTSFWPDTDSMRMTVREGESPGISAWFSMCSAHRTVLVTGVESALVVEVSGGSDSAWHVKFEHYQTGDSPLFVSNYCNHLTLKLHQHSVSKVRLLPAQHGLLYTWDEPTMRRQLLWNIHGAVSDSVPVPLHQDGWGSVQVTLHPRATSRLTRLSSRLRSSFHGAGRNSSLPQSSSGDDNTFTNSSGISAQGKSVGSANRPLLYWISMTRAVDGGRQQRHLVVTDQKRLVDYFRRQMADQVADVEMICSLADVGVSLVSSAREEIAYASLCGSPGCWSVSVNDRWKPLSLEISSWLENRFLNPEPQSALGDYLEVDLERMVMVRPYSGQLQRSRSPALWLHGRRAALASSLASCFHLQLHSVQIDNQVFGCVFPVALYTLYHGRPSNSEQQPPPFLDLCVRFSGTSLARPRSISYARADFQEISLQLDAALIANLVKLWLDSTEYVTFTASGSNEDRSSFDALSVDFLHISAVTMSVSLSPRADSRLLSSLSHWLLLAEFLGTPVTEVTDVTLRLDAFNRSVTSVHYDSLAEDLLSHYKLQLLTQVHAFIFGLDVLGNPYGLVQEVAEGLTDFIQETSQGWSRGLVGTVHGVVTGTRHLMGHIVSGTAESASLVVQSAGDCLSLLSLDEHYRRKRRRRYNQRQGAAGSAKQAARSLVSSIIDSLSGLVFLPYKGACRDGVRGFLQGAGRGVVGLLMKPVAGVLDMTALLLDSVARAAQAGHHVMRQRLPRHIDPTQGVRPYSAVAARGRHLLQSVCADSATCLQTYLAHEFLGQDQNTVCLLTTRSVMLIRRQRLFSDWRLQWSVDLALVGTLHKLSPNTIELQLKHGGCLTWLSVTRRVVTCIDLDQMNRLHNIIDTAMSLL